MEALENKLNDLLVKNSPVQLPVDSKKKLVEWLPIINLVLGAFQLWAAWSLWHLGHLSNNLVDYTNSIYRALGANPVATNHLGLFYWVSLIVLAVDAVVIIAAYPGLKARSKARGWNFLFYGLVLNAGYGVVRLFSDVGSSTGSFFWAAVSALVGLFFLFQVRSYYNGGRISPSTKTSEHADKK